MTEKQSLKKPNSPSRTKLVVRGGDARDDVTLPWSPDSLAAALRELLADDTKSRRRALQTNVSVAHTTLHYWLSPESARKSNRKPLRPDRGQVAQLALLSSRWLRRLPESELNRWAELAGYTPEEVRSSGDKDELKDITIAAQLDMMFKRATALIAEAFPKSVGHFASIAAASYFSQLPVTDLISSWREGTITKRVFIFWQWREGVPLKRLEGIPLKVLNGILSKMLVRPDDFAVPDHIQDFQSVRFNFFILSAEKLKKEDEDELQVAFSGIDPKVRSCSQLFVQQPSEDFFADDFVDAWAFQSATTKLLFVSSDHDDLYQLLTEYPTDQQLLFQREFNPYFWASQLLPLDGALVDRFLSNRGISAIHRATKSVALKKPSWWKELVAWKESQT